MKCRIDDLAIFGGPPAFADKQYVGRPNTGDHDRFLERVKAIMESKWLTNEGPYVREFERKIAETTGAKHCIAMCNATVALEIAIRALGLSGEVIVPSFTFVATAHALQWQEITPVFCDILPDTHNLDPAAIERLITPRTTGIIGVHLWGRPCDIDAIQEIARSRGLKLLFDAAHAFGCSYQGRMIGNFGDAEVFSFHATKFLNSFEGGAVVTNDDDLAHRISLMKNFGFWGYDNVVSVGTNGKMTEVSAAMGLTSLESMESFIEVNYRNYCAYREHLEEIAGIRQIEYGEAERRNFQYVVVEVDEAVAGIDRDQLQKILWDENVIARRYFYPGCHGMEPYRSYFPNAWLLLPETEKLGRRVLALPTGTGIDVDGIRCIADLIRFVVKNHAQVRRRLGDGMAAVAVEGVIE